MDRRSFIKLIAIGFVPIVSKAYNLSTLEPKSAIKYQDHPHDREMCCMCKYFIPPGENKPQPCHMGMMNGMNGMVGMMRGMNGIGDMMSGRCEVVAGRISPMGWCILFQKA